MIDPIEREHERQVNESLDAVPASKDAVFDCLAGASSRAEAEYRTSKDTGDAADPRVEEIRKRLEKYEQHLHDRDMVQLQLAENAFRGYAYDDMRYLLDKYVDGKEQR